MLKHCLKMFVTGITLSVIGGIGIGVLLVNGLISTNSLNLSFNTSESAIAMDTASSVLIPIDVQQDKIDSLDFTVSVGEFSVVPSENFSIRAENVVDDVFEYEVINGCLKFDYSPDFNLNLLQFDYESPVITVTVPEKVFEKVNFSVKAGTFNADCVKSNNFTFLLTAGEAYFTNVATYNSSQIKMTAGDCCFKDSYFTDADIELTAGDMNFDRCSLADDNKINMTAGELYMALMGSRSDYKISIDKTAGDVYINGYDEDEVYTVTTATAFTETVYETAVPNDIEEVTNVTVTEPISQKNLVGTIDIKVTAGDCNIDFMEEEYYE